MGYESGRWDDMSDKRRRARRGQVKAAIMAEVAGSFTSLCSKIKSSATEYSSHRFSFSSKSSKSSSSLPCSTPPASPWGSFNSVESINLTSALASFKFNHDRDD